MKIVKLVFAPSSSADVAGYELSWSDGVALFPVGDLQLNAEGNLEITLNDVASGLDGTYTFSIVAIDDAGNRSEASVVEDVTVDFLAPAPPGQILVVVE